MNCEQAQEEILLTDEPAALLAGGDSELGRHVVGCAVCWAFVERLVRLEAMAEQLPLPANSDVAREQVLENLRERMAPRLFLRPAWISAAVAAVLVIGIGVA